MVFVTVVTLVLHILFKMKWLNHGIVKDVTHFDKVLNNLIKNYKNNILYIIYKKIYNI